MNLMIIMLRYVLLNIVIVNKNEMFIEYYDSSLTAFVFILLKNKFIFR